MSANSYTKLAAPKFVADEGSLMYHPNGLQIDWSTVAADSDGIKRLAAGTLVHILPAGTIRPAVETTYPASGILVSDVDDQLGQNKGFHGVFRGGAFWENLMATPPTSTQKTEIGERFVFATYADTRTA